MGVVRLVAICDLGEFCGMDYEKTEEHLEQTIQRLRHREHIRSKHQTIRDYVSGCVFRGETPLRVVAGMIAWSIRKYRRENKFYECV